MPKYPWLEEVAPARPASGDTPSASPVYRHKIAKEGFPTNVVDFSTLLELFENAATKFPQNPCLGKREIAADGTAGPYKFKTYAEVHTEVKNVASALRGLGVQPQQRVSVFGPNCPEWMIAMQACNRMSMHCVPLYDTLGENAIEYIINHSESVAVFVAADKLPRLVKALDKTKATLKSVCYWGSADAAAVKAASDLGYKVLSFSELQAEGAKAPVAPVPPSPEDLCTIMYTSGTTGDPKGVMLTHKAVVAAVATARSYCAHNGIHLDHTDSLISYLPLAHIFDRVNEEWFLSIGAAIGYWQGDVLKLVDDIAELKPSLFIGVPRVFDRIYARITGQIKTAGFVKNFLFNWGFNRKLHYLRLGYSQSKAAPVFDKILFSKIAARLGGRVKAVVSGGAPLAPHVEDFLRVAMCAPVVQGYGLTETSAASFIACADRMDQAASVGPPTPMTEFRLESVPDMKCDALDPSQPKGEVLIRGPMNFLGYYKAQDKTDEVLEKDGWFHTGDIAVLQPSGAIKIVDRKKNIFKLSQGEYVAVEQVEATYKKSSVVEQIWVYGNSFESCLVAVVVPNKDVITAWASSSGVSGDYAAVLANPKTKAYIMAELIGEGKAGKLKGYELLRDIHIEPLPFSVEDDLMTPSFKLKRPQLQEKYQKQIDAMYAGVKKADAAKGAA